MESHVGTHALDRAAELRAQPEVLARLARSDDTQLIVHRASAVPVTGEAQFPRLVRLPTSAALERGVLLDDMMFLGLLDGTGVFGLETLEGDDDLLSAGARWVELIVASMTLPALTRPLRTTSSVSRTGVGLTCSALAAGSCMGCATVVMCWSAHPGIAPIPA